MALGSHPSCTKNIDCNKECSKKKEEKEVVQGTSSTKRGVGVANSEHITITVLGESCANRILPPDKTPNDTPRKRVHKLQSLRVATWNVRKMTEQHTQQTEFLYIT